MKLVERYSDLGLQACSSSWEKQGTNQMLCIPMSSVHRLQSLSSTDNCNPHHEMTSAVMPELLAATICMACYWHYHGHWHLICNCHWARLFVESNLRHQECEAPEVRHFTRS